MAFRAFRRILDALIGDEEEDRQVGPTDPELWRRLAEKQELVEYLTTRVEYLSGEIARYQAFVRVAQDALDSATGNGELIEEEDEDGPSG